MGLIVGREKEISELNHLYCSDKAEFVAIYGRRRIGKTFLVDEALKGKITFRHAGLSPVDESNAKNNLKEQLKHFYYSLLRYGMKKTACPKSWQEAFYMLSVLLEEKANGEKQVVFLDELPWMDTTRSGFITAFEGFWNTWACHRDDMMLVVCGSANSWMLDNLVNNHGGLYGRTTYEIKLKPFSLNECEKFFQAKGIAFSRYDIVQSYMILGGVPFYMGYMKRGLSLAQNIDALFFNHNAPLRDEYDRLFASVFANPGLMKAIISFLSSRRSGFTRTEILEHLNIDDSGSFGSCLKALEASDFIVSYVPYSYSKKTKYYKVTDPFCLFFLKHITDKKTISSNFWTDNATSASLNAWRGLAFENVCFVHIAQIKKALGISGVATTESAWVVSDDRDATQIDMIIERKDNIVDICEMKFYNDLFSVSKDYYKKLVRRNNIISGHISPRQTIHNVLITTDGLTYNEYSGIFQNVVTLDNLFE